METKANYVLIGLFTLAVIAGVFGFIYWFSNISGSGVRTAYRVIFQTPVPGLRTGANVLFNGIRVGDVVNLDLDPQNPKQVIARIAVALDTPVRADTVVGLDFQGLTGIAALSLRGGSLTAPPLVGRDGQLPTLVADASATQDVTQAAREALKRIENVVADNEAAVRGAIKNIEVFSATLARNSERIDSIMVGLDAYLGGPDGKGELQQATRSIRTLSDNLDTRVAGSTREFDSLMSAGRRTLAEIERAVRNFDRNPSRIIFGGSNNPAPEYNGRPGR